VAFCVLIGAAVLALFVKVRWLRGR
jgi:hypothetical protein